MAGLNVCYMYADCNPITFEGCSNYPGLRLLSTDLNAINTVRVDHCNLGGILDADNKFEKTFHNFLRSNYRRIEVFCHIPWWKLEKSTEFI